MIQFTRRPKGTTKNKNQAMRKYWKGLLASATVALSGIGSSIMVATAQTDPLDIATNAGKITSSTKYFFGVGVDTVWPLVLSVVVIIGLLGICVYFIGRAFGLFRGGGR